MKLSKEKSLFSLTILLIINSFINNIYLLFLSIVFLLITNKRNFIVFVFLVLIIFITNISYTNKKYSIGIVEDVYFKYSIVNNGVFKVKVHDSNMKIGDIVVSDKLNLLSDNKSKINNIRYESYSHYKVGVLKTRVILNKSLNKFNGDLNKILTSIIYNNSLDSYEIYLGNGYAIYFVLRKISRKNSKLFFIVILLSILFISFDIKHILLILNFFLDRTEKCEKIDKFSIKLIVFIIINKYLLFNYSICIPLLISFLNLINFANYKSHIYLINSYFFGKCNILQINYFEIYSYIRLSIFIFSVLVIIVPNLQDLYLFIIKAFSCFNKFIDAFSVRGKISIISIMLFLVFKCKFKINKMLYSCILIILIMLPINNPFSKVAFINVGQGDSILIRGEFGLYNILIDTGSTYNYNKLKSYLDKQGIYKLDYVIITHDDSDHNGSIDLLKKDYRITEIITNGKDINIAKMYLKYLYIDDFENDNDNSLVYLLTFNDIRYLLLADVSKNVEKQLIMKYEINNIDVLKVSHHGSKTGTSKKLISYCLPKIGIISTSGAYNHPDQETLNILNSYLVDTYITKDNDTCSFINFLGINLLKTDGYKFVIIN